jgi:ligand-binding SRPBCC domain-containing protein
MKYYHVHREELINKPLEEVFAFFARPENLEQITPSSLGFVIKTPTPIEMKKGALIDYTIRVNGVPLRWRTLITEYDPLNRFVDEQVKGPYAYWQHKHTFKSVDGGTLIIDDLKYALPLGWLGQIAHWVFVSRKIRHIFDHRSEVIRKIFFL